MPTCPGASHGRFLAFLQASRSHVRENQAALDGAAGRGWLPLSPSERKSGISGGPVLHGCSRSIINKMEGTSSICLFAIKTP